MNCNKLTDQIVGWLSDYCNQSNTRGFVLGVSGGIDSAVVSTLCAKTGKTTQCLSMPIHQAEDQLDRGHKHLYWLSNKFDNVLTTTIDLTACFDTFAESISPFFKTELSLANSRSRLRMTTLYCIAGAKNFLVAGTGNKVEDFGVFFCTKYGDAGVDISPIGRLMKSEVYQLGAYLGLNSDILSARPTDGLWADNRTDEDQLGASYDDLEWAMKEQEEGRNNIEGLSEIQANIWNIYIKWHEKGLHKIKPIPICPI